MRIVAGRFRGKKLNSPVGQAIRPTTDRVRESVFNLLMSRLGPTLDGVRVLDLFAGTGAIGIEALSRGADYAVFVETDATARGLIREHIIAFGVAARSKLLRRDATDLGPVGNLTPFDLVFLDPPYGQGLGEKALASAVAGGWIAPGATIVSEDTAKSAIDPPDGFAVEDERRYGDTAVRLLEYRPWNPNMEPV